MRRMPTQYNPGRGGSFAPLAQDDHEHGPEQEHEVEPEVTAGAEAGGEGQLRRHRLSAKERFRDQVQQVIRQSSVTHDEQEYGPVQTRTEYTAPLGSPRITRGAWQSPPEEFEDINIAELPATYVEYYARAPSSLSKESDAPTESTYVDDKDKFFYRAYETPVIDIDEKRPPPTTSRPKQGFSDYRPFVLKSSFSLLLLLLLAALLGLTVYSTQTLPTEKQVLDSYNIPNSRNDTVTGLRLRDLIPAHAFGRGSFISMKLGRAEQNGNATQPGGPVTAPSDDAPPEETIKTTAFPTPPTKATSAQTLPPSDPAPTTIDTVTQITSPKQKPPTNPPTAEPSDPKTPEHSPPPPPSPSPEKPDPGPKDPHKPPGHFPPPENSPPPPPVKTPTPSPVTSPIPPADSPPATSPKDTPTTPTTKDSPPPITDTETRPATTGGDGGGVKPPPTPPSDHGEPPKATPKPSTTETLGGQVPEKVCTATVMVTITKTSTIPADFTIQTHGPFVLARSLEGRGEIDVVPVTSLIPRQVPSCLSTITITNTAEITVTIGDGDIPASTSLNNQNPNPVDQNPGTTTANQPSPGPPAGTPDHATTSVPIPIGPPNPPESHSGHHPKPTAVEPDPAGGVTIQTINPEPETKPGEVPPKDPATPPGPSPNDPPKTNSGHNPEPTEGGPDPDAGGVTIQTKTDQVPPKPTPGNPDQPKPPFQTPSPDNPVQTPPPNPGRPQASNTPPAGQQPPPPPPPRSSATPPVDQAPQPGDSPPLQQQPTPPPEAGSKSSTVPLPLATSDPEEVPPPVLGVVSTPRPAANTPPPPQQQKPEDTPSTPQQQDHDHQPPPQQQNPENTAPPQQKKPGDTPTTPQSTPPPQQKKPVNTPVLPYTITVVVPTEVEQHSTMTSTSIETTTDPIGAIFTQEHITTIDVVQKVVSQATIIYTDWTETGDFMTFLYTTFTDAAGNPTATRGGLVNMAPFLTTFTDAEGHPTRTGTAWHQNGWRTRIKPDGHGGMTTETFVSKTTTTTLSDDWGRPTATMTEVVTETLAVTTLFDSIGVPTKTSTMWEPVTMTSTTVVTPTVTVINTLSNGFSTANLAGLNLSSKDYFLGLVLPPLLAVAISIPVRILDQTAKLYQPFHALTSKHGAETVDSLCLQSSSLMGFVTGVRSLVRHQVLLSVTGLLLLINAVLIPLSAEAFSISVKGPGCSPGTAASLSCDVTLQAFPTLVKIGCALLSAMIFLLITTTIALWKWKTGVWQNPWSMEVMGELAINDEFRALMKRIRPKNGGVINNKEAIKAFGQRRFSLEGKYYSHGWGYGVLIKNDAGSLLKSNKKNVGFSKMGKQSKAMPFCVLSTWGRVIALTVLIALLITSLVYISTGTDSNFEHFMDGDSFGVRFLFCGVGVVISLFWATFFNAVAFLSPYRLYRKQDDKATLLTPPTNAYSGLWEVCHWRHPDGYLGLVAFTSILSDVLPVLLANVPSKVMQASTTHLACTWLAAAIMSQMLIVITWSFLVDWPHMSMDPSTVAGAIYFALDPGTFMSGYSVRSSTPGGRSSQV